ncbi:MAG: FAD-dependent oxidoreductase, partial [Limnohabitans sp.]|nr:FAD-dependent oxidoreductase [Limnohabitans sp.]
MVCALTLAGPLSTQREHLFDRLRQAGPFDVAVIGGGATGAGIALEAAVRGYSTVLLEAHDLAKGTSSRATKLVHGGVRYLAQGQWSLVRDALHERQYFFDNAPHLAQPLSFVIPAYQRWDQLFYGLGLRLYDAMAGQASAGKTRWLSAADVHAAVPTLNDEGLCGGIRYWDGQFDDARMVLAVVRTAALKGACVLNHCPVTGLIQHQGQLQGLTCRDVETGITHEVMARCVINATGVWSDTIQQ